KAGADSAKALPAFARELAEARGQTEVAQRVVEGSARILSSPSASLWLQDADTGDLRYLADLSEEPGGIGRTLLAIPATMLRPWLDRTEPYFIEAADYAVIAPPPRNTDGRFAIAPFTVEGRWGV